MADKNKDEKKIRKKMPKIIYTSEEEDWLVTNVMEYRNIIENKKTDGATNRDKQQAWEKITSAFNVAPPVRERAVKSLREKYQKIKKTLKDRACYFSKHAKRTGGGPPKKELPPLSEPMKKLAELIMPPTIGLPKMPEQKQQHATKKRKIEIEILECERERAKFDRNRAALDRERSAIELQRSKAQLLHDTELHRVRLAALNKGKDVETVPICHISSNPIEAFPIAAAKNE